MVSGSLFENVTGLLDSYTDPSMERIPENATTETETRGSQQTFEGKNSPKIKSIPITN